MKVLDKISKAKKDYDVVHLLGGSALLDYPIHSAFDFIELSSIGLKKASLNKLIDFMGITKKDFVSQILNLSPKTLERKKDDELLDKQLSSHIIEVAKVVEHAYEVFEEEEKVKRWLSTSNRALNNRKPIDLFYIPTGLIMVDQLLGRIEEGVYS